MDLPTAIACPCCPHTIEVSEEDSDATLSDMREHLFVRHARYNHAESMRLLALVKEVK